MRLCQCPQRAYFHFYSEDAITTIDDVMCVNALNGLTSISTDWWSKKGYLGDLCQCPQRAYFHFYGSLSEPLILLASESYFYK